jgi:hypothetical protein
VSRHVWCSGGVPDGRDGLWRRSETLGWAAAVIAWRRVPWSLGLYILWTVGLSGWLVFHVSGPIAARVLFSAIVLTWAFFMLNGVRWLWIATVAVSVLSFVVSLITDPQTWYSIVGGAISIGLLLLPATRRYFARESGSPRVSAG